MVKPVNKKGKGKQKRIDLVTVRKEGCFYLVIEWWVCQWRGGVVRRWSVLFFPYRSRCHACRHHPPQHIGTVLLSPWWRVLHTLPVHWWRINALGQLPLINPHLQTNTSARCWWTVIFNQEWCMECRRMRFQLTVGILYIFRFICHFSSQQMKIKKPYCNLQFDTVEKITREFWFDQKNLGLIRGDWWKLEAFFRSYLACGVHQQHLKLYAMMCWNISTSLEV